MDSWLIILIVVIVIMVLAILIFNAICHKLIFRPPKQSEAEKQAVHRIDEDTVVAEYLPSSHVNSAGPASMPAGHVPKSEPIVVYSHGNGTDIRQLDPFLKLLAMNLNCRVYAYEYPGYSYLQNQEPNGPGCTINLQKTLDWLIRDRGHPIEQITLMGQSLGSGPTVQIAKRYPELKSVVLISAYKSLPRVLYDSVLSDLLVPTGHLFPSYRDITQVRSPIVFVHGKQDTLIPSKHSEDMYRHREHHKSSFLVQDKLILLDDEGHNITPMKVILTLKQQPVLTATKKVNKIEEIPVPDSRPAASQI